MTFKKTILVTGISGFLGNQLVKQATSKYNLIGTYHRNEVHFPNVKTLALDIQDEEAVEQLIMQTQPDAVFHFAALSNTNFCEQNPELSFDINVKATINLAMVCQSKKIPFLFTSTDLIFDGQSAPYSIDDPSDAICVYGQHKVQAEQTILELYPEAIIARCPLMYGLAKSAPNFLPNWINQLKSGNSFGAFTDEYRTTASGESVVKGLLLLLENKAKGIWHLGGKERVSRYDFAIKMAEVFDLDKSLINGGKQADVKMPAARPADVSMDSQATYALGFNPPDYATELERLKREMKVY